MTSNNKCAVDKRFTLRIEQNIYELVKKSAEKNKRSIAKEIGYILQQYLDN